MTIPPGWVLVVLALGLGLAACADYQVTLNDQPLYRPPTLAEVEGVTDDRLATCLKQTISDQGITAYPQLQQLTCSYGGIETLEGLQQFTGLQRLDLSHNQLGPVAILSRLTALQAVDLSGNPGLECEHLGLIRRSLEGELKLISPGHCQ